MQPSRTAFAEAAMDLAKLFELFVGQTAVPATNGHPYQVSLTTPHGPSTGGGKQRLQHITFSRGNRTFVVGSIDSVDKVAEVRGHESVNAMHQERWKEPVFISHAEYENFLKRLRAFATGQQIAVVIKEIVQPPPVDQRPQGPVWPALLVVILLLGGLAGLIIYIAVNR